MNHIAITLDVDWSPDFVIEKVANSLKRSEIKATWFATHYSKAIQNLLDCPLFEVGIHPDFIPCNTMEEYSHVMKSLMNIVPNARIVRTHGLFQSSIINKMMAVEFNIDIDSSIYLREVPNIIPFETYYKNHSLLRLPFYWTEDGEWNLPNPSFRLSDKKLELPGLKIFVFHPIHIYLNSCNPKTYSWLKTMDYTKEDLKTHINPLSGANTLFEELMKHISTDSHTLTEIADKWRNEHHVH